MAVNIEDAKQLWLVNPHEINDEGKIVYRLVKVSGLVERRGYWDSHKSPPEAMFAKLEDWTAFVGLVTLESVEHE